MSLAEVVSSGVRMTSLRALDRLLDERDPLVSTEHRALGLVDRHQDDDFVEEV